MRTEPGAYGQLGLSDLFEMREECLREFGFSDVYRRACYLHALHLTTAVIGHGMR